MGDFGANMSLYVEFVEQHVGKMYLHARGDITMAGGCMDQWPRGLR